MVVSEGSNTIPFKRAKFGDDQHENVTVFDTKYVSIFFYWLI